MTLDEFILESKSDIQRFEEYWLNSDRETFPLELDNCDWYEQFLSFNGLTNP